MTSLEIVLPEPLRAFVEEQVVTGGYATPSEYVHTLIREAHERQAQDHLEALLLEGLDSGPPVEVTSEYWEEKRSWLLTHRKSTTP